MKQYFIDKLDMIKEWLKKEKWFLILLSVMTVSLFVSMFTEYGLIAVFVVMIAGAILFNFEKGLCIFLFSYAFEAVFYIVKDEKNFFVFTIFYSILFSIYFFKYVIEIIKKKSKINLRTLIPLVLFVVYILIPINNIKFDDLIKYLVAFGFIYLILEKKDNILFKNLIIIACFALTLSIVFSFFTQFTNRMQSIMGLFYNNGIIKKQGLFTNPNWLAVYTSLIIAWVLYNFVFVDYLWGLFLLVLIPYSYSTLSRNFMLCLIISLLFMIVSICIKRSKVYVIRLFVSFIIIAGVMLSQFTVTKVYWSRLKSTYNEISSIFIKQEKKQEIEKKEEYEDSKDYSSEEYYWIDGTPIDPGRIGIWKRYIKDFKSSPKNIILGAGISAEILGIFPHNSFINILWQFGITGFILLILVFWLIGRELIKGKNLLSLLILGLVCFISLFESNVFNYVAIMMIILLIASTENGGIKKEKLNEEK